MFPTNNSVQRALIGFDVYFKVSGQRFIDPLITAVNHNYSFNIVAFDDWLHRQGYTEEEHGSMQDYITSFYGEGAVKFIRGLLGLE